MIEQAILPWEIGTEVSPKKGEHFIPFKVAHLVYPASLPINRQLPLLDQGEVDEEGASRLDRIRVVVDEKGFVHWRLGQHVGRGHAIWELRHNGGRLGAPSMDVPINQADRIFDRILGFTLDLDIQQGMQEEKTIAVPTLTFSAALVGLRAAAAQVEIPGEQARIRQYLSLVEGVVRGQTIPTTTPNLEVLTNNRLRPLLQQLSRRQVPLLKMARERLELYLTERDDPKAVDILLEVQDVFFERLKETSGITANIAKRQIAMRKFRSSQEDYITRVYRKTGNLIGDWEKEGWREDQTVERVRILINSKDVLDLDQLVVQPFKHRGFTIKRLLDLEGALTSGNLEMVSRSIQEAMIEMQAQERHTSDRRLGENRERRRVAS